MNRRRAKNLEIHNGHREMAEYFVSRVGLAQAIRTLERFEASTGDPGYLAAIDAINEMTWEPELAPTEVTS